MLGSTLRTQGLLRLLVTVVFAGMSILSIGATEITQYFPAVSAGQSAQNAESGWRIRWEVIPGGSAYGTSPVWEIQSVEFMKGWKDADTQDWITVLNHLALVEMYVPYGKTFAFMDICCEYGSMLSARDDYLPETGVISATREDRYVISEVVDDGVRWLDNRDDFKLRRGQALRLWASLRVANYTYIILYLFFDDGRINARVGGTSQNLLGWDGTNGGLDSGSHVHMGAWRMEFDLGDSASNRVEVLERAADPSSEGSSLQSRLFNNGQEGGEAWTPDGYTLVKITNEKTKNRHDPPRNVAYVLKTVKSGRVKTSLRQITQFDYWVSRLIPDDMDRQLHMPLLKYSRLPESLGSPESVEGHPVVIWHNAGGFHISRGEDFGPVNYNSGDGAAIASYVGFDLVPVDLWDRTPFMMR